MTREQRSLRSQVTILVVGVIAALAALQAGTSLKLYRDALSQHLRSKGDAVARAVASDSQLKVGLWAGYQKGVDERLRAALGRERALRYLAVVDNGKVAGIVTASGVDKTIARAAIESGGAVGGTLEARADIDDTDKPAPAAAADDLGLLDPGGAAAPAASAGAHRPYVVAGIETDSLRAGTLRHLALSVALGLIAVGLATILVGRLFAGMFRRMRRVSSVAETMASGDLRDAVGDDSGDEIGAVSRSVDRIRERWTQIVREIRGVADEVVKSTKEIATEAGRVAEGSAAQADSAAAAAKKSSAIVADAQGLKVIVDGMASITRESNESLSRAREVSSSVAGEMDLMIQSLRENDGHRAELTATIGAITGALAELTRAVIVAVRSSDDVARRVDGATGVAAGIADHARAAVAQSGQALSLLEKQRNSAEGVARGAQETAAATIALQEAMSEVLNTTALIRDIADMTSMLSLNASIIAAQAGDRALGFGTVAEEIRSLATRTRGAVDGIEQRAAEARRQLETMSEVVGGLSATVQTSRVSTEETTTVLEKVLEQMNTALTDVSGLAALMGESSHGTRAARDAVGDIERSVSRIDGALQRQRASQQRLDESSDVMGKNAGGVRDIGREQAMSTGEIIEGMVRLARATEDLVSLAHAQSKSAEGIAHDTQRVKSVADRHRANVDAIAAAVANLDGEARALRVAIQSLQVD